MVKQRSLNPVNMVILLMFLYFHGSIVGEILVIDQNLYMNNVSAYSSLGLYRKYNHQVLWLWMFSDVPEIILYETLSWYHDWNLWQVSSFCRPSNVLSEYELSTSSNLFAMRRNFNLEKSVAGCCVIVIHDMNTYKLLRFCRPSNVPGAIPMILLLGSHLRW